MNIKSKQKLLNFIIDALQNCYCSKVVIKDIDLCSDINGVRLTIDGTLIRIIECLLVEEVCGQSKRIYSSNKFTQKIENALDMYSKL